MLSRYHVYLTCAVVHIAICRLHLRYTYRVSLPSLMVYMYSSSRVLGMVVVVAIFSCSPQHSYSSVVLWSRLHPVSVSVCVRFVARLSHTHTSSSSHVSYYIPPGVPTYRSPYPYSIFRSYGLISYPRYILDVPAQNQLGGYDWTSYVYLRAPSLPFLVVFSLSSYPMYSYPYLSLVFQSAATWGLVTIFVRR